MMESGFPDFEMDGWAGKFTAGKTPREIIARLQNEINKALAQPQMVAAYANVSRCAL